MLLKIFSLLIFAFLFINSVCFSALNVVVSIVPQKFFVKKIAADMVRISVVVPPGYNPAVYDPAPSQIKEIEKANVYFTIGVPFERAWIKRFVLLNKDLIIVPTDKGIKKRKINFNWLGLKKQIIDPHIWLSPPLVKKQVKIIADTLKKLDPEHKDIYEHNLKKFLNQINQLDQEIADMLREVKGREFLVFHPCWGYFAERYGLKQLPMEIQGKELSGIWLAKAISYCKKKGFKVIFVQPQFSKKIPEIVAKEIGANLITLDPLAENWAENLKEVAKKIKDATSF